MSIGREGIRAIVSEENAALLTKHINLYAFGEEYMETSGFKLTDYGVVIRNREQSMAQVEEPGPQMTM